VVDYIAAYHQELFKNGQTCAVTTPYRSQSLLLKNTLIDREGLDESIKKRLLGGEIGAFDELVSRTFDTIIISVCKTKNIAKSGGPLLNNQLNIDFLKSRCNKKFVIIGKAKALNTLWKSEFYEPSKTQDTLIEL
jgi:hypothetical protein